MKSLKEYSLNISEQAYHLYNAWSYSIISKYAKDGFAAMATLHDRTEPTQSMEFGSLFDSMITKGKQTLDDYRVLDYTVPAAEKKVLDTLAQRAEDNAFALVPEDLIAQVTEECQYYPKWGIPARLKHLAEYSDYYSAVKMGKKIVSKTDWDDAVEMFKVFRANSYLKDLFGTKSTDDIEYLYQTQFVTEYHTLSGQVVLLKIMPDLLKIDHKNKTVQPVDLKTSSMPAWDFKENFLKFRYDIQAHLYTDVLRFVMDNTDDYHDYVILPYLFTDISRTDKIPVTYEYNPADFPEGFKFTKNGREYQYKTWQALLEEILDNETKQRVVPEYISLDRPNDLCSIINNH